MINSPIFTIVIPTFNRAHLISETINTVLNQTFSDFELIIIDNASTDNTDRIIESITDRKRIIYHKSEVNKERSHSRNKGIKMAKGEFITFLDSDDFMYPNALMDAYSYIIKNSSTKFFHNKFEFVDNDRNIIYQPTYPSLENQYLALCSGNFLSCIGVFLHKSVYKNIRFNTEPKMIGSEDYEIWFDVLSKYKLGRIDKINSGVREHSQRTVNRDGFRNLSYQREYFVNKISSDPKLSSKFGIYIPRIKSSYYLIQSISRGEDYNICSRWSCFFKSIYNDPLILFTRRVYATIYNLIKISFVFA